MDQTIDVEEDILENRIDINLSSYDGPDDRKVHAAVINRKSDPHIISNARMILEERIATKTKKCSSLALNGPVWLALFNDYFLADGETYKHAIGRMSMSHVFDRIFLISGNRFVATLYDKPINTRIDGSRRSVSIASAKPGGGNDGEPETG
jgi:hypothetical protein